MNNSNKADSLQTQNSLEAIVNGESFVATEGFTCIKEQFGWRFSGTSPSPLSFISFYIKSIKPGSNDFKLTPFDNDADATGFYFAGSSQLQSNSGTLHIKYFETVNRMEGSFNFVAKSGNLEYDIKGGEYALTVQQQPLASQSATAKISGSLNMDFVAQTINIVPEANARLWIGGDYRPNLSEWYRMVLSIPETLQPDTDHSIDNKEIKAFFYDMSGYAYRPESGTIRLLSDPTKEHFDADFSFDSEVQIPSNRKIRLSEGKFRFQVAKTPVLNSSES